MNKRNTKIIALIAALSLSTSLLVGATPPTFRDDTTKDKLIKLLKDEITKNGSKNSSDLINTLKEKFGVDYFDDNNSRADENQNETVRVIVQLTASPAAEKNGATYDAKTQKSEDDVISSQNSLIKKVEGITGTKVKRSFGYLVNGFSIETKRGNIDTIRALKGIKNVTEVIKYYPDMEYAKEITQATKVWQDLGIKGEGMVVSIIDTGIDFTHKDLKNIDSSKIKLNSTEVNKKLPEVKGGKYFTEKVPFGYNYADGNNDIIDKGSQHGQHVAGIVGANGVDTPNLYDAIKGVAPEAQLLAMKVFSNNEENSGAFSDDIIAAIEDSVKLGADVINMSLGSNAGFMDNEDPQQIAVKNATNAGVICSISAGNSQISDTTNGNIDPSSFLGIKDNGMVGSPGVAESAVTVASMENLNVATTFIDIKSSKGFTSSIAFSAAIGSDMSKFESEHAVEYCGIGQPSDFDKVDVNGKVALIQRGTLSFADKYNNAISRGAIGVIIFNNSGNSLINMSIEPFTPSKPAFFIGATDGTTLKNKIVSGDNTFSFKNTGTIGPVLNTNKDKMSFFSSWGPTPNLELKPDITAPGGMIYSLANNNGYQNMSGTSMSSPHNAGGQALIMQAIKKKNLGLSGKDLVEFAKYTSMNTATPLIDKRFGLPFPYSPRVQGAGVLQIENAINNNVLLTDTRGKANLAFKNVGNSTDFTIKLKNYSNEAVTYSLKDEDVYSQIALKDLTGKASHTQLLNVPIDDAKITFNSSSVTVSAKGEATVSGKLIIPDSFEKQNYVEGFISLNSTNPNAPAIGLPFLGFYGDFDAEKIVLSDPLIIPGEENLSIQITSLGDQIGDSFVSYGAIIDNNSLTIDNSKVAFSPNGDNSQDKVMLQSYLLRNAKEYRIDVLDKDGNLIQTPYLEYNKRKNNFYDLLSRGSTSKTFAWDGMLYDSNTGKSTVASDGQYTIRLATSSDFEGAKPQTINFPIKIDTLMPEIKIDKVTVESDKTKASTYKLTWTASDSGSGIMDMFAVAVNDQVVILSKSDIDFQDGLYSASIPFKAGTTNDIGIIGMDNAGNMSLDFASLNAEEEQATVSFINLYDGLKLGAHNVENGIYTISGYVGPDTKKVTINGNEMLIENNRVVGEIALNEGVNQLDIKAFDSNNKDLNFTSDAWTISLDTSLPILSVTPDISSETPFYTVDTQSIDLDVQVSDKNAVSASLFNIITQTVTHIPLDSNGTGKISAQLSPNLNLLEVIAFDNHGNQTSKTMIINRVPSLTELNITLDIPSFYVVSPNEAPDGKLVIHGFVNKLPKEFKIAGKDITINKDLTFETEVDLIDGSNRLLVYAVDTNDKIVYNYSYRVLYDSKAPTISFKDLKPADADGKIYVNNNEFTLQGDVTDNLFGYTFSINGNVILSVDQYPSEDPSLIKRSFKENFTLKDGENYFNISLTDQFGNTTSEDLTVVLDTKAPIKPVVRPTTTALTNKPVLVSLEYDKDDVVKAEYSFDGESYFPYTTPFEVSIATKVYGRVYDKAGNVSEIGEASVNVDMIAPKASNIKIDGVTNGGEYFDPVKISITSAEEDVTLTATLNSKAYKGEEISAAGEYVFVVYATDKAGNKSEEIKISFKLTKKEGGTIVQTGSNTSNGTYVLAGLVLILVGASLLYSQRKKKVTE